MIDVTRPLMRYHGAKWRLGPWILRHLPGHRVYVEPFGGAGSVLLQKPRSEVEVYNDVNPEVVNAVRMARERGPELAALVGDTPFTRASFMASWEPSADALEQARRTLARSFMGHGADAVGGRWRVGYRGGRTDGTFPADEWERYPQALLQICCRLMFVRVECRDAVECMREHDAPDALHYVDPPYVPGTRGRMRYRHDMDEDGHVRLAGALMALSGAVVLSGYACPLYDELFESWRRVERPARGDKAKATVEVLWIKGARSKEP